MVRQQDFWNVDLSHVPCLKIITVSLGGHDIMCVVELDCVVMFTCFLFGWYQRIELHLLQQIMRGRCWFRQESMVLLSDVSSLSSCLISTGGKCRLLSVGGNRRLQKTNWQNTVLGTILDVIGVILTLVITFVPHGVTIATIGRLINGIGQGMVQTAGSVMLSELPPINKRGTVLATLVWLEEKVAPEYWLFTDNVGLHGWAERDDCIAGWLTRNSEPLALGDGLPTGCAFARSCHHMESTRIS